MINNRSKVAVLVLATILFSCTSKEQTDTPHAPFDPDQIGVLEAFRTEEPSQDGERVEVITYYADSSGYERYFLRDGVMDGEYTQFYPSGNLKQYVEYKDGVFHGPSFRYYDAFSPSLEANSNGSERDTTRKEPYQKYQYYKDGELICTVMYDRDQESIKSYGTFVLDTYMKEEYVLGQNIAVRFTLIKPPFIAAKAFLSTNSVDRQNIPFIRFSRPEGLKEFDLTPYISDTGKVKATIRIEHYRLDNSVLHTDAIEWHLNVKSD